MIVSWYSDKRNCLPVAHKDGLVDYSSHCLDVHAAVFPVDPNDIKVERCHPARDLWRAKTAVVSQQRRNLLLVSIANSLASVVRLEERGRGISSHACRWFRVELIAVMFRAWSSHGCWFDEIFLENGCNTSSGINALWKLKGYGKHTYSPRRRIILFIAAVSTGSPPLSQHYLSVISINSEVLNANWGWLLMSYYSRRVGLSPPISHCPDDRSRPLERN